MTSLEDYILSHYSDKSLPRYLQQIKHFKAYQDEESGQASYKDILEYIEVLRARNLHPKTIKNHLFSLKIYFRYLVRKGVRKDNPCQYIQLKDQINRSIHVESLYSKEQLEELYKVFESRPIKGNSSDRYEAIKRRDKVILSLLIYQALTRTELVELKTEDIDLQSGRLRVREQYGSGRRGNSARTLGLKSKQIMLFSEYLRVYRNELLESQKSQVQNDYFVLSNQGLKLWSNYLNRMLSKVPGGYSPMKIRQSVIANLLKENKDLRIVQAFAGHRRAGSTEAYKQTGLEELKASIDKLHPLQGTNTKE